MGKIINYLAGKKTYIVAFLGIVANGCFALGYITGAEVETLNMVLGFLGLGTVRLAISKQ